MRETLLEEGWSSRWDGDHPTEGRRGGYHRHVSRPAPLLCSPSASGPLRPPARPARWRRRPPPRPASRSRVALEGSGRRPRLRSLPPEGPGRERRAPPRALPPRGGRGPPAGRGAAEERLGPPSRRPRARLRVGLGDTTGRSSGRGAAAPVPLALRSRSSSASSSPGSRRRRPVRGLSVPLGGDVVLTTLLGSVSRARRRAGRSPSREPSGPSALDTDRSGRLYVATGGVGGVLRLAPAIRGVLRLRPPAPRRLPPASRSAEATATSSSRRGSAPSRSTGPASRGPATARRGAARDGASDRREERPPRRLRQRRPRLRRGEAGPARAPRSGRLRGPLVRHRRARRGPRGRAGRGTRGASPSRRGRPGALPRRSGAREATSSTPRPPAVSTARGRSGSRRLLEPPRARSSRASSPTAPRSSRSRASPSALLLGKEEEAAVPAVVDLAPGLDRRLYVLLEDGSVFAVRPF